MANCLQPAATLLCLDSTENGPEMEYINSTMIRMIKKKTHACPNLTHFNVHKLAGNMFFVPNMQKVSFPFCASNPTLSN